MSERDTNARCPKCRSRSFDVTYLDEHSMTSTVIDGRFATPFEVSSMPSRTGAYGECSSCKHQWRFRHGWIN